MNLEFIPQLVVTKISIMKTQVMAFSFRQKKIKYMEIILPSL